MKNFDTKKKYESPILMVTELETEDVITISALIGQDIIDAHQHLGYGTVLVDFE